MIERRPASDPHHREVYDIGIIGGGINGCGIARDAAGRGLKVFLCEQADLGSGASSASSKLIHGGLRYLEQYQFKLVRESLQEREILLKTAPHLIAPMRFVLPRHPTLRPAWVIRLGLLLYDALGGHLFDRRRSPWRSRWLELGPHHRNAALKSEFAEGFEYADCHTDDSRLVVAVAQDARRLGAVIATRAVCDSAARRDGGWEVRVRSTNDAPPTLIKATALVNAAGPWVSRLLAANADLAGAPGQDGQARVKLVQGSHIVVRKWYDGEHAYLLQNRDQRMVFVIPFEHDWVIIGTTEREYHGDPGQAEITRGEIEYLCDSVNRYFTVALAPEHIVWSYSGVRPLYDDGACSLGEVTRDYVIELEAGDAAPLLTIYGGKLTTFRRLAEAATARLAPYFPAIQPPWSARAQLPGGKTSRAEGADALAKSHPFLPSDLRARYLRAYGEQVFDMLGAVDSMAQMGQHFGHGLYQIEAVYLIRNEWAACAEDILWRRSKLGLRFTPGEAATLQRWLETEFGEGISTALAGRD